MQWGLKIYSVQYGQPILPRVKQMQRIGRCNEGIQVAGSAHSNTGSCEKYCLLLLAANLPVSVSDRVKRQK